MANFGAAFALTAKMQGGKLLISKDLQELIKIN